MTDEEQSKGPQPTNLKQIDQNNYTFDLPPGVEITNATLSFSANDSGVIETVNLGNNALFSTPPSILPFNPLTGLLEVSANALMKAFPKTTLGRYSHNCRWSAEYTSHHGDAVQAVNLLSLARMSGGLKPSDSVHFALSHERTELGAFLGALAESLDSFEDYDTVTITLENHNTVEPTKVIQDALQRYVMMAAIKFGDILITGRRHYDELMNRQIDIFGEEWLIVQRQANSDIEGFVDQYGVFMDRVEAMNVVKANGQPFDLQKNGGDSEALTSEGVW